jgi:hypothetical protein
LALIDGLGMIAWVRGPADFARLEPAVIGPDLRRWGCTSVIIHQVFASPAWCTSARVDRYASYGVQTAWGLGFRSPSYADQIVKMIVVGLDACKRAVSPLAFGELDWEGSWDRGQAVADKMATAVLAAHPDAAQYLVDVPWWAPLETPDGTPTHPGAPTRQFGRIVSSRYVQAYGAPILGHSQAHLDWARSPTQYPSLGTWPVRPTFQGYSRSVQDIVATLLQEPNSFLWDYLELSPTARFALDCVAALRRSGFSGPDAVRAFQARMGLKVDGILGPKTALALRCTPPSGVIWYGNG